MSKNRRYVLWLFFALLALNVGEFVSDLSIYKDSQVMLGLFREGRPVRAEDEGVVAKLSEQARSALSRACMHGVQIAIIGFLWIYFARETSSHPAQQLPHASPSQTHKSHRTLA